MRIEFGEQATGKLVDGVLARIGYQYAGDSPPAASPEALNPSIELVWRFTDSEGAVAEHKQSVQVYMSNDSPMGDIFIDGVMASGETLKVRSTLVDPDGPLDYRYYFWSADGTGVATPGNGVDSSSLTLSENEIGKTISVRVAVFDSVFNTRYEKTAVASSPVIQGNRAPVSTSSTIAGYEDTAVAGELSATDTESNPLSFEKVSDPNHGAVVIGADGRFSYTPAPNYSGSDSFSFRASDGALNSAVAIVTINLAPVNDAPSGSVTIAGAAAQGETLTVSHSLVDADGLGTVAYQWFSGGQPIADATGPSLVLTQVEVGKPISVQATYADQLGNAELVMSAPTGVVANVEDAPVASTLAMYTNEDTRQTGTLSASDIDSVKLTSATASPPAPCPVPVPSNGTFTYTPALNFNGTDSFTFKASDGSLESGAATVTITVAPINDPATGSLLITGTPGQGLTLQANLASFSDVDGAPPPSQAIRYEWRADNTVIANVSGPDLFLAPGLTGKSITVRAHFKDGLGTDEFVASSPSGPVLPGSISGEVRYWHGNEPVAATQIRVLDSDSVASSTAPIAQASSTADGRWSVPQLDFDTFAVKASRAVSATDHSSVSAADVLAALKLSVGRTPNADPDGPAPVVAPAASPYQMIASDVTRDGFVRSDDAMLIMHAALKPASSPIWHWSFIAEGQDLFGISRHATFIEPPPSVSVVNGTTSNWIGVLLGEVDGSWNPGVSG